MCSKNSLILNYRLLAPVSQVIVTDKCAEGCACQALRDMPLFWKKVMLHSAKIGLTLAIN